MNSKVTQLLDAAREGNREAVAELLATLQAELRAIAARHLAHERRNHTLQATALVNEAYVRLVGGSNTDWTDRGGFLAYASTAMRRVLIEHARARLADRRGGGAMRVTLFDVADALQQTPEAVVALDEALHEFARLDPRGAEIVELRWYGGLSNAEVASTLEVSERTVERGWRAARAWLSMHVAGR